MKTLKRNYSHVNEKLAKAGLRPTRQRILLGDLMFGRGHRHVSAEALHRESKEAGIPASLATIYNTLHQFRTHGLLKEIVVEGSRTYFDTNTETHHHMYCEDTGMLTDIPEDAVTISNLPSLPAGLILSHVDVILRVRTNS